MDCFTAEETFPDEEYFCFSLLSFPEICCFLLPSYSEKGSWGTFHILRSNIEELLLLLRGYWIDFFYQIIVVFLTESRLLLPTCTFLLWSVVSCSNWCKIFSAHLNISRFNTFTKLNCKYYSNLILLDCFLGTAASCILFSLMGEALKSNKLSVSFLDSLIGDKGVLTLNLELPLLV